MKIKISALHVFVLAYAIFGLCLTVSRLYFGLDPQHNFIRYFNLLWYTAILANVFDPKLFSQNSKIMFPILILGLILNLSWIFKIV